jgi:hypothetical protein
MRAHETKKGPARLAHESFCQRLAIFTERHNSFLAEFKHSAAVECELQAGVSPQLPSSEYVRRVEVLKILAVRRKRLSARWTLHHEQQVQFRDVLLELLARLNFEAPSPAYTVAIRNVRRNPLLYLTAGQTIRLANASGHGNLN